MFGFFRKSSSKKTARNRLTAVISRDRANVSAEFILKMTAEIINAALKYIEPDYDKITVNIERNNAGTVLCARLPIVKYNEVV